MLYVSHLLEDREMRQLISGMELGIESIEFSIAENLDHFDETMKRYKERLERMKCQKLTLHGPFLDLNPAAFDRLVQKATRYRYEQAYEAAQGLGAKKIIFHSCFVPSVYFLEGWPERVADFYNEFLADKADEIQILMENVLDPFPEPFRKVGELIEHSAFGLCLDIGHAHCYSKASCLEWAKQLQPYIRHVHLHDNCGQRDEHLALGAGSIEWTALQQLLSHVEGTIECRSREDVLETISCWNEKTQKGVYGYEHNGITG